MKHRILSLLLFIMVAVADYAQSTIDKLIEIKSDPTYIVASTKSDNPERARKVCRQKLLGLLMQDNPNLDMIDEDIIPYVQELEISSGGTTELYLYMKRDALSGAPQPSTESVQTVPSDSQSSGLPAKVQFSFTNDWAYGNIRNSVEQSITALLNAINAAYPDKQIDFTGINISEDAKAGMNRGFSHFPYYCTAENIVKPCMQASEDLTVRDIPVFSENHDDHNRCISIAFDHQGQIECVRFAAETASYDKIMKDGGIEITDATDAARRTSILSFVENYRNYYIDMDIDKIDQIFADDAIIVTGSVIRTVKNASGDKKKVTMDKKVVYKRQSKDEYLASLKKVFANNQSILVLFDDIRVCQDPDRENIYGVTLKQSWDSKSKKGGSYHDDGYVFLLWDFQNPEEPQIHIRTWQPLEGIKKEEDIFSLSSFRY